ncbi:LOW QUALITY PROTEIN: rop guanine nucleotide exchange factor 14-like [Curcuma longa]|uniref:LOW QUALITY PROTEIN: rop guanine nucleotide exchange factor 14-like n=1 Tax=Curcuma longa TaxID=136217 RepID=UPI003D9ED4C2
MKRLACCRRRTKDFSLDFEDQDRVITYNGLESCILNSCSYDNESAGEGTSGADGCVTADSLDEDASSCSSSKDGFGSSFSSQCLSASKQEDHLLDDLDTFNSLHHLCIKGKAPILYSMDISDVEAMKEKFAKLLLGEDVLGGTKGISTALTLSHAITNLAASIFGELWKLEPLSVERKRRWHREIDWLLSPTSYMVELVPAKQNGANGGILEIMTQKSRSDVHLTIPALKKLDSMLIEILDSMVNTEFWYAELGSRANGANGNNGTRHSKKWWIPSPCVPESGLSPSERRKLGFRGKFVYQILKAAQDINEQVLTQMPIPSAIEDALPKSGKASLGVDIYYAIAAESVPVEEVLVSLNMENEHVVLDTINRLEGAIFAWKLKMSYETVKKSPMRFPWSFVKEHGSEIEKISVYMERTEALLHLLKIRFPDLPPSFIDVSKVRYNKDIGHSIVEAYSRVLVSLSFNILSRIGDILQEDDMKKSTTPISNLKFDFTSDVYRSGITETPHGLIKRSLIQQMNMADDRCIDSYIKKASAEQLINYKANGSTIVAVCPRRSVVSEVQSR